jgi:proline racemase
MRKPASIRPPCGRSRAATLAWLNNVGHIRCGQDYRFRTLGQSSTGWRYCFNVKLYAPHV